MKVNKLLYILKENYYDRFPLWTNIKVQMEDKVFRIVYIDKNNLYGIIYYKPRYGEEVNYAEVVYVSWDDIFVLSGIEYEVDFSKYIIIREVKKDMDLANDPIDWMFNKPYASYLYKEERQLDFNIILTDKDINILKRNIEYITEYSTTVYIVKPLVMLLYNAILFIEQKEPGMRLEVYVIDKPKLFYLHLLEEFILNVLKHRVDNLEKDISYGFNLRR